MTDSQTLGVVGGALSAIGVFLALVGTTKIRAAVKRFTNWLSPQPVQVRTGSASMTMDAMIARGRGRVGPGPEGWTDEEWHAELEKRIDQLAAELDNHDHADLRKAAERLSEANAETRRQFDSKLVNLTDEAGTSERWNIWGLGFAFAGALAQVLAVVVA